MIIAIKTGSFDVFECHRSFHGIKFPLNPKKWLNKFFICVYNVYIVYIQYNEFVGGII